MSIAPIATHPAAMAIVRAISPGLLDNFLERLLLYHHTKILPYLVGCYQAPLGFFAFLSHLIVLLDLLGINIKPPY